MLFILKKLFCLHKWVRYEKKEYRWTEKEVISGTEYFDPPVFQDQEYIEYTEVLICEHCGKIEIIEY